MTKGYDFIGDLHGMLRPLEALLVALGYERKDPVWRHPEGRKAMFVGDLMDRGPKNRAVIALVRAMVDAGEAHCVLGNHEFNAVHFATPHPDIPGRHLRERSDKNLRQHHAFLSEYYTDGEAGMEAMKEDLRWIRSLPPFLDLGDARMVHACWNEESRKVLAGSLDDRGALTDAAWILAGMRFTPEYRAAEVMLKGPEKDLPEDFFYHDKEGTVRRNARMRWWRANPQSWGEAIIGPDDMCAGLDAAHPVPDHGLSYDADQPPVFFGHYWMHPVAGRPVLTAPNAACLDFSVGAGGDGVVGAYRWDGEQTLSADKLIGADVAGRITTAAGGR
jgi:hypothetical protein